MYEKILLPPLRKSLVRGGSRTVPKSKMELFVIIANGWKPLTTITKSFILDVAAVLDPPLLVILRTKTPLSILSAKTARY